MQYQVVNVNYKICWCPNCACTGLLDEQAENGSFFIKYGNTHVYIVNGRLHNETGPAQIRLNEAGEEDLYLYYLKGRFLTKEEWEQQVQTKLYW